MDRAGEVVARSELHSSLWSDEIFVDFDKGLGVAVTKVRAALSDSVDNPKYIETVAGKGYRFIARVERITTQPTALMTQPLPSPKQLVVLPPAVDASQSWMWRRKAGFVTALMVCLALLAIGALNFRRWKQVQPRASHA